MNTLDAILREFVAPRLASRGFARRGRTFRRRGSNGNFEIVAFTVEQTPPTVTAFYVQVGVAIPVERPWLSEQLRAELAAKPPGIAKARYVAKVMPPIEHSFAKIVGRRLDETWGIKSDAPIAALGLDLAEMLESEVLPIVHDAAERGEGEVTDTEVLVTMLALRPFRKR